MSNQSTLNLLTRLLPEVKQVVVAYGDHIAMEATFDEALQKIVDRVEKGIKPEEVPDADGEVTDEGNTEEDQQDQPNTDPILNADEVLGEVSDLFNQYQKALSEGDWQKAGEIMSELDQRLK